MEKPRKNETKGAILGNGDLHGDNNKYLHVLYTWSSSTIPSFPPPKTIIKSLIETARCPCLGLGHGPEVFVTLFHFNMGAAILKTQIVTFSCPDAITLLAYHMTYCRFSIGQLACGGMTTFEASCPVHLGYLPIFKTVNIDILPS